MSSSAQLTWQGHPVCVVRSARRRKTVQLRIRQQQIICRAPQQVTDAEILEMLEKKSDWITRQLQRPPTPSKRYVDGEIFHYLGQPCRLRLVQATEARVQCQSGQLIVTVPEITPTQIQAALTIWYQHQARRELMIRVDHYQGQMLVSPTEILIKTYKSRWGTCYADGRISFDWRIVMAPSEVINYVVVHELCHLIYLNHSAQFWHLVQHGCPGYQAARDWLKQHANTLEV